MTQTISRIISEPLHAPLLTNFVTQNRRRTGASLCNDPMLQKAIQVCVRVSCATVDLRRRRAPIEHRAQDLGGHDDAACLLIERHITCHQPHIRELLSQLPVLLVAQSLERTGVHNTLLGGKRLGNGIFSDNGLARGCMRRHHDRFFPLLQQAISTQGVCALCNRHQHAAQHNVLRRCRATHASLTICRST